jgi:hypothetical protein
MTETVTTDRPPVAKPVARPRFRKPATVNVSALARHLDCSPTYIGKLEGEGVTEREINQRVTGGCSYSGSTGGHAVPAADTLSCCGHAVLLRTRCPC